MNAADLLIADHEKISLANVFLEDAARRELQQFVKEHRYVDALEAYGLQVSNKILLHGHSGCGKTMTAKGIAQALDKKIMILNLGNIVNARIGETSQQVKMVFEKAGREGAVLFLDEFDLLGKARGKDDKDVGEMRRLVNTIIQLVDYYPARAVLIAATNHADIIDSALLRRFQLKLGFGLPSRDTLDDYYDSLLARFPPHLQAQNRLYDISFAEARDHIFTAIKAILIATLENDPHSGPGVIPVRELSAF